jgi:hypothetical protein
MVVESRAYKLSCNSAPMGSSTYKRACDRDQSLRKVRIDALVPRLIGIGQSGTRDRTAKTHVIEFAAD